MLWVGLFTALATSGLLVFLLIRKTPEAGSTTLLPERTQTARHAAGLGSLIQSVKRVSRRHTVSRSVKAMPGAVRLSYPYSGKYGYEIPFTITKSVPINTPKTETDPVKLYALLNADIPSTESRGSPAAGSERR